jgi:signal transduction histidine kinase
VVPALAVYPPADDQLLDVRVLIVEDEAIIAHDVASMLEGLGYSIAGIAASAPAALAFAGNHPVDIVLMDIRIRGEMDGIRLAGELKQRYGLPVVYMTAHTDDVTLARARETEPFGYITKPMTSADIKVALCIALRRHRLQWQSQERESSLRTAVEHAAARMDEAQHELSRSRHTLALLTNAISTDLKQPLQAISISASMLALENHIASTEKGRQYLDAIRSDCRHLDSLMTALLDYFTASSLERKGAQPVQASEPLRLALAHLRPAIDLSRARITTDDLPQVLVHPMALMLIFENLLANSIKFAGDRAPLIFISAAREGDFCRFTVEDSGVGFDPSRAHEIFQLFKRAHGPQYAGTGLGLALCHRLVSEHGGKIWAESQSGQGAKFHFTLPAWFVIPAFTVPGS